MALLGAFWIIGGYFGVREKPVLSFALLLAPYWAFGFGLDRWLRPRLTNPLTLVLASTLLMLPYLVYALPRGQFRWGLCLAMLAIILAVTAIPYHWLALAILALAVELHLLDAAWPAPGLGGLAKLLLVDAALYRFLVARPIAGIGFDFRARWSDLKIGLREFLFYTPVALALGFLLGFLHLHKTLASPLWFASGWIFTLFFIALPEELFFRGLILNLLERRVGTSRALWITSILFGLAHFNKRAAFFNWRYVILAALAGFFYGRAWLAQRRLMASSITHATVDTVWSIWLR